MGKVSYTIYKGKERPTPEVIDMLDKSIGLTIKPELVSNRLGRLRKKGAYTDADVEKQARPRSRVLGRKPKNKKKTWTTFHQIIMDNWK